MKSNRLIVFVITLVSFLLSTFVLYTPIPRFSTEEFSAVRAASYIEAISREPHSVFDPDAHETVRQYLIDTVSGFVGAENVLEMNYTKEELGHDTDYGIQNILATIPGTSDTGILLVAHYDSRGHIGRAGELGRSYGAADDGYGLATMLEIARLYGDRTIQNTIYLLFTDAEETGLFGAEMAAKETWLMEKVGFVVNLEARGVDGPAYMFETSVNNRKVVDFYRQAELPVSYSLATAVYTVMPNSTDFTEFLAIGKQGVNFAVLKGLYNYHTPFDNYTAISLTSIQHYGSQIVPLVETFVSDPAYASPEAFEDTTNSVFFTILPNVFVAYSEPLAIALNLGFLVLFVLFVTYLELRKKRTVLSMLQQILWIFGAIALFAVVGLVASKLIAFLGKTTWSLTYVRMTGTELPTLLILLATTAFLFRAIQKKVVGDDQKALMLSGIFLNLFFATLTGFVLSGASFLFFVPAAVGLLSLIVLEFVPNKALRHIALAQNIVWNLLLLVPILSSLFLALTVGGLLALLVLLIINLTVVLPSVSLQLALE